MNPDTTSPCGRCGGARQSVRFISGSPRADQGLTKLREECDALYEDYGALQATFSAEQEFSRKKDQRILELEEKLSGVEQVISQRLYTGLQCLHDGATPVSTGIGLTGADNGKNDPGVNSSEIKEVKDEYAQEKLSNIGLNVVGMDKKDEGNDPDGAHSSLGDVGEGENFRDQLVNLTTELKKANTQIWEIQMKNEHLEEDIRELRNNLIPIHHVTIHGLVNHAGPSNVCYNQLDQTTQSVMAENEQLKQQHQMALMLAGDWANRFRGMERKMQRYQQIVTVLEEGSGLELYNEPAVLFPPERADLPQPRFHLEICNLEECKNCRRFLTDEEFNADLCWFHSCRPLSISSWQRLFPDAGESRISMYKDYLFWPCCNKLARKAPEGCSVNRHEKINVMEIN